MPNQYTRKSVSERFWAMVNKYGPVPKFNPKLGPCWLWTGKPNDDGYGRFRVDKDTLALAHRWSYEHAKGPIPSGYEPDHKCRVRACVRDSHLELITKRENILRSSGVTAEHARQTHCIHGHEFTPENTYLGSTRSGRSRVCKTCRRLADQRRDSARKKSSMAQSTKLL